MNFIKFINGNPLKYSGDNLTKNEEKTTIKKACVLRCLTAKSDVKKCKCRCGGKHHGQGTILKGDEPLFGIVYASAQNYKKLATKQTCHCGTNIMNQPVQAYPHSDGWEVEETAPDLQWLYIPCPVCKNDVSIWKLGVSRTATIKDCE